MDKIIFLDIDGVLNDYTARGIYKPESTDINMINNLNFAIEQTGAKIIIISNWAQVMTKDRLNQFLVERGLLDNVIIDVIKPKEFENRGIIMQIIDKSAFIYEYINLNQIVNYVIVGDDLKSKFLDQSKIIVPSKCYADISFSLGITEVESQKIISLLNG